jgi:predicted RNase H-like HicB family nuclease
MTPNKTLDYYLSLPYPILLIPDQEEGTWYARIPVLPGCMSDGDTPSDALHNLEEALHLWLETALEDGDPIPEPGSLDALLARLDAPQAA